VPGGKLISVRELVWQVFTLCSVRVYGKALGKGKSSIVFEEGEWDVGIKYPPVGGCKKEEV